MDYSWILAGIELRWSKSRRRFAFCFVEVYKEASIVKTEFWETHSGSCL